LQTAADALPEQAIGPPRHFIMGGKITVYMIDSILL
jgi:hypothetical protein